MSRPGQSFCYQLEVSYCSLSAGYFVHLLSVYVSDSFQSKRALPEIIVDGTINKTKYFECFLSATVLSACLT